MSPMPQSRGRGGRHAATHHDMLKCTGQQVKDVDSRFNMVLVNNTMRLIRKVQCIKVV